MGIRSFFLTVFNIFLYIPVTPITLETLAEGDLHCPLERIKREYWIISLLLLFINQTDFYGIFLLTIVGVTYT
jgi:hypothetical protein